MQSKKEELSLRYISDHEIDDKEKVSSKLLKTLDRFISTSGMVFNIHSMAKGKHSENSAHYQGLAADGSPGKYKPDRVPTDIDKSILIYNFTKLINKKHKNLFDLMAIAMLSGFTRIGIYPHWSKAGLHLDIATEEDGYQSPLAWIGLNVDEVEKKLNEAKKNNASQIYFYIK